MNFKNAQRSPATALFLTTLLRSFLPVHSVSANVPDLMTETQFERCPKGSIYNGQQLTTMDGRSALDCMSRCARLAGCETVNVCPSNASGRVSCSLMSSGGQEGCQALTAAVSPSCFFARKTLPESPITTTAPPAETTTTKQPIVCQNGGISNGTHCACPIQYSGLTCDRYIRDCSEAYENGYKNTNDDGVYLIQPIDSPTAFHVICMFAWGGITKPLQLAYPSFTPNSWSEAKAGFGDDLPSLANATRTARFFIGLEKLHMLTRQAGYNHHIMIFFDNWADRGSAFYDNFTVGPESSSYAVTYSAYYPMASDPADNGLNATQPLVFCTQDRDTRGCATSRGAPGWYGADCSGYSMFRSNPTWPVFGVDVDLVWMTWSLVRLSPFYVDP